MVINLSTLIFTLLSPLLIFAVIASVYLFDYKLRFINPVKSNDMIRGVFKLKEVTRRNPNEILFTHDLTIEIKDVKNPAIVCEWLNLSIF